MSTVPAELLGMRYRAGNKKGHLESWSFKASDPKGRRALWVRLAILARTQLPAVAEAWAIAFDRHRGHVAVKSTIAVESARFGEDAVDADVDGCSLRLDQARGALVSGRGALKWDVAVGPELASPILHLAPRALYDDHVPPWSKLVTPLSDARAHGQVTVERGRGDVDVWDVAEWPAMVSHHWGRGNAELSAWTHCNAWDVPELTFEAVSARVRVGPMLSPMVTSAFVRWRGRRWDLSRLGALTKNRGLISLRRWEMTGYDSGLKVTCDVAAENDDIVGLHYMNPFGPITNCLATTLARARLEVHVPGGQVITATSRAASLEIATIEADHGIRMYL